jgi:hypothetical protein
MIKLDELLINALYKVGSGDVCVCVCVCGDVCVSAVVARH